MRTKEQFLMLWMLGGMMLAGLAACSGDDDTATDGSAPQTADDGVKVRHITITETEEEAARQIMTRASLAGLLIANSTAATSQFTGDVYCLAGDYLAVVYPATTFETNDSYTISLTGQNGTLSKLATNYHYVFGKATVTEVTETTANATIGKMKSLLTVCKFSFKDKNTGDAIPIKSLSISYSTGDSNNGKYPQSATVAIGVNTAQNDVHATGADITAPLTITASGQTEVYVALLPTAAQSTFNFTVSDGNGNTYSGTANATLVEGEYVDATGLKLTKQ